MEPLLFTFCCHLLKTRLGACPFHNTSWGCAQIFLSLSYRWKPHSHREWNVCFFILGEEPEDWDILSVPRKLSPIKPTPCLWQTAVHTAPFLHTTLIWSRLALLLIHILHLKSILKVLHLYGRKKGTEFNQSIYCCPFLLLPRTVRAPPFSKPPDHQWIICFPLPAEGSWHGKSHTPACLCSVVLSSRQMQQVEVPKTACSLLVQTTASTATRSARSCERQPRRT